MKNLVSTLVLVLFFSLGLSSVCEAKKQNSEQNSQTKNTGNELAVLWTSGDKDVAEKMVFMYTYNAAKFGWWDKVHFIVWGPSSKLLSEDSDLQEYIQKMKGVGINLYACKACADMYKVSEKLEKLGLDVKYMGKPLTEYLKSDCKVVTF